MSSAEAIRRHYDVGNDFYRLWLDPTLSYSCAWRSGADSLEQAQEHKLRRHLAVAGARRRLLDVGCGWGGVLARAGVPAVGLTLSAAQGAHVAALGLPNVEVRVEDWRDHVPVEPYDGIVSIGAFEHFAAPGADKVAIYREFFTRCREWLSGGALSLQTIAYADMDPAEASAFMQQEIFRDAELPTLAEIAAAAEGVLEITSMSNGRLDYAWTCAQWARRLKAHRGEARELVGAETVARYERYLTMSSFGFRMSKLALYRITLRPYGSRWGA
ncbi:SAM-dependent methyltransferase [Pseudonocardia parietis]|uniref:Cyclopropane-fatty-acyl-phospholipid synthase n=1 Tax=Pseudonocardia parietis TaxID=570936 RepID=A0ABS4W6K9_9PSEU|nr:cyclopropane-fatty-acyl-phospholipid synthase family protein [Pseudonocardia parietis]MBP2371842.1 cyclopropane-fatty-acyl-phospholipid synthase [Pseudonocardia parietis]